MRFYNPFREIVRRLFAGDSLHQPVPDVTEQDVSRIVRREFPQQFDSVMNVLNRYGADKGERERVRVCLAALKLADGDMKKLNEAIESAKRDYRDVLAPAEYPEYSRTWRAMGTSDLSRKEAGRIISADFAQHDTWLRK